MPSAWPSSGSIVSSLYSDDVDGKLGGLPPQAREQASSSIGAANVIASHLPGRAGTTLAQVSGDAFTTAMAHGLLVGAGLAGLAALLVARFLPGRERAVAEPVREPIAA